MRYVTRDGVGIEVGRVDRRLLDAINIPAPVPPTRSVEAWGGIVEQVPVLDDPGYVAALFEYKLKLWREQIEVITLGISFDFSDSMLSDVLALEDVFGEITDIKLAYLRYCMADVDRSAIVDGVLYSSTVTQRGISEACKNFAYKWREKPLLVWHIPTSNGERGKLAVEWRAAIRSGLTWGQFCNLPGDEQSAHVAFWMLEDRLNYLLSQ